tara:strand:- start:279 stop:539 length:261 start_codon:yes stop_codon:yes gene_type:complete
MNLKVPKSDIKIPKKIRGSRTIKSFFGFIACLIGSFLTVSSPFSLWNLFFLIVLYRGYEYLERHEKSISAIFVSSIGLLLGLLTYF